MIKTSDFEQTTRQKHNALMGRLLLLVVSYFVAGRLGLLIHYVNPNVSLLWLPAGIAVASLIRYGNRMLFAIYLASVGLEISAGYSSAIALSMSIGNTLGPLLCALILRHLKFNRQFVRRKDAVWFTLASMAGMMISATGGSLTLWQHDLVEDVPSVWLTWWTGDVVGTLLIAPLLLSVSMQSIAVLYERGKEALAFILILCAINWLIFLMPYHQLQLTFVAVAAIVWPALRFGVTGASLSALASATFAAWATSTGRGPFTEAELQGDLLILWIYMITMVVVALLITSLQAESARATYRVKEAFERINKVASRLPGLVMQYRIRPDRSVCMPYATDAIMTIFEVTQEQVAQDALFLFDRIDKRDMENGTNAIREATRTQSAWQSEFRFHRLDGSIRWLYIDGLPEPESDGAILWHCFVTDITERKEAERDLRIAAFTFESQEGIFVTDAHWMLIRVNHAFTSITGFDGAELLHQKIQHYYTKQQDEAFYDAVLESLREHQFWQGELWNKRKNGEIYPQMITLTAISDSHGEVTNYIGSFTDISRHKGYEAEIRNLAFYDPLTQLPNRRLLMDRLQHLINKNLPDKSHSAILFIDLDNFKTLNDTRGHDAGDILLVETASRLQRCMREIDTVARLGGG